MTLPHPAGDTWTRSVLFTIHFDLDPNKGAAGATLDLADATARSGSRVAVLSLSDLPAAIPVQIRQLVLFPLLVAWWVARARGGLDVLDASSGDAWLVPLLPRRWRPRVVVARSHGLEHTVLDALQAEARLAGVSARRRLVQRLRARPRLGLVARTFRAADVICLLNEGDARYARAMAGVRADRVTVVRNALPEILREAPAPDPAHRGLAFVGEWNDRKGARVAAATISRVLADHPHVTARLIGTRQPAAATLDSIDPAVRHRVEVVPSYRRAEVAQLLADRAVLLFPSVQEGAPLAVLEAMAAGLAVVAGNIPGPREMVQDSGGGVLVPPSDVGAFVAAVARWFADPSELTRVRRSAWEWARVQGWEAVAEEHRERCRRSGGPIGPTGSPMRQRTA